MEAFGLQFLEAQEQPAVGIADDQFRIGRLEADPQPRAYVTIHLPDAEQDVAAAIAYAFSQPPHVNVNELALRPLSQGEDPFRDGVRDSRRTR